MLQPRKALGKTLLAAAMAGGITGAGCGAAQEEVRMPRREFTHRHLEVSLEISRQSDTTLNEYVLRKSYPDSEVNMAKAENDVKDALRTFARSQGCDSLYFYNVSKRLERVSHSEDGIGKDVHTLVDEKSSYSPDDFCNLLSSKPQNAVPSSLQSANLSKLPIFRTSATISACDENRNCDIIASESAFGFDVTQVKAHVKLGSIKTFSIGGAQVHVDQYVESFAESKECLEFTAKKAEVKVHKSVSRLDSADDEKTSRMLVDGTSFFKPKDFCTGIMQYPAIEAKVSIEACNGPKRCETVGSRSFFGYSIPSSAIPSPEHYEVESLMDVPKAKDNVRGYVLSLRSSQGCQASAAGKSEMKVRYVITRSIHDAPPVIVATDTTIYKPKNFCSQTSPEKKSPPQDMPPIQAPGF